MTSGLEIWPRSLARLLRIHCLSSYGIRGSYGTFFQNHSVPRARNTLPHILKSIAHHHILICHLQNQHPAYSTASHHICIYGWRRMTRNHEHEEREKVTRVLGRCARDARVQYRITELLFLLKWPVPLHLKSARVLGRCGRMCT